MLTLVRTGETDASPKCKCGSICFVCSGIGWSCVSCGLYVPARLGKNTFEDLKGKMQELVDLHGNLKKMLIELEDIVGKR